MHIWTLFKTLNEASAPSNVNPVFSNQINSLLLIFFYLCQSMNMWGEVVLRSCDSISIQ